MRIEGENYYSSSLLLEELLSFLHGVKLMEREKQFLSRSFENRMCDYFLNGGNLLLGV